MYFTMSNCLISHPHPVNDISTDESSLNSKCKNFAISDDSDLIIDNVIIFLDKRKASWRWTSTGRHCRDLCSSILELIYYWRSFRSQLSLFNLKLVCSIGVNIHATPLQLGALTALQLSQSIDIDAETLKRSSDLGSELISDIQISLFCIYSPSSSVHRPGQRVLHFNRFRYSSVHCPRRIRLCEYPTGPV